MASVTKVPTQFESIHARARACVDECEPDDKVALTRAAARRWREGGLDSSEGPPVEAIPEPGRPARPELVAPRDVPRRRNLGSSQGRAVLIHALAHIEFNAINLAWDAVYRFRDMPRAFYDDWVRVADEEAYHFTLLVQRLNELGWAYGDFPAHNGLWEMACRTDGDVLVRMALVPRVLEARGLDVTPGMVERLRAVGDERTVEILEIILRDEIGHVAIGTRWFQHACGERGVDPEQTFPRLLRQYMKGRIKGPFHERARYEAGFTENDMANLRQEAGVEGE